MESIESGTGVLNEGTLSKTPEAPLANSFFFNQSHVLYGKLRPYLNKVFVPDFEGKCSTEIIPLRPSGRLERDYLAYYLRSPDVVAAISAKTSGARMPRADMDYLLGMPIPLPDLSEQRRIVDLLTRTDSIAHLRREAQRKASELIPAIFLDMFGDPAMNPRCLPNRRVSDFVAKFESGKNLQAGDTGNTPYRILKVSAVTSGIYLESESKPTPNEYTPPASHVVRKGDLLFSRANTEELVGATVLVDSTNNASLLPDKLWRFVFSEEVEPLYILALFQNSSIRKALGRLATGTSASMRNISQAKLMTLKLPVASHQSQREFANKARQILSIISQQSSALSTAEATFAALMNQSFPLHQRPN